MATWASGVCFVVAGCSQKLRDLQLSQQGCEKGLCELSDTSLCKVSDRPCKTELACKAVDSIYDGASQGGQLLCMLTADAFHLHQPAEVSLGVNR